MKYVKIILVALNFLFDMVWLYSTGDLSFWTVLLAFVCVYVTDVLQRLVHEGGHLLGGFLSGYKPVELHIGRVNMIWGRQGRMSLSLQKTKGGQCIMTPSGKGSAGYYLFNAGGMLGNAILTVGSVALLFWDSPIAVMLFAGMLCAGSYKFVINAVPRIHNGLPNDGYILKVLKKNPRVQYDYAKYLTLYAEMYWEEEIRVENYTYERESGYPEEEYLFYNGIQELLLDLSDVEDTSENELCG